ncbi:DUF6283 family protein [Nonomuraea sp. KM90]|uniref:DUF6283 family protein n=1 Tax=Nonomuraea sp. KM90 TaxID=3457428 RepID=UPI003FCE846F
MTRRRLLQEGTRTRAVPPIPDPSASAASPEATEFRSRPCSGERVCPWRTDADLTAFSEEDMLRLQRAQQGVMRPTDTSEADVARLTHAPRMACHKDQPDTAHPMRLCAGWLAVVGPDHIGVRLSVFEGSLPPEAVEPDTHTWPALHASLAELLARRQEQLAAQEGDGAP